MTIVPLVQLYINYQVAILTMIDNSCTVVLTMNSPLEQPDRNRQIYLDKINGMTFRDLSKKYDLSINRLQFIVQREKQKAEESQFPAPAPLSQVPTLEAVKAVLHQHWETLTQTHKVKSLGIFGSVARGEATPASDIDMLAEFSEPIGMFQFIRLENYLTSILSRKVDLGTPETLKPIIKDQVLHQTVYV
jgi:uncharacterized protein